MNEVRSTQAPDEPPADTGASLASLTVVGVGASAGGLKALQQFFEAVPPDSGMAYVVILHLDPERESRMGALLQDRADIPLTQVDGPTALEANHIYLIPPGKDLAMRGTTLGLRDRGERSEHAPIDLFFRTLAEGFGPSAIGVVLSGTGSDGTGGIRYIREAGGITVAQSPDEAEYDPMPASAISTGLVDLVLKSSEIPAALLRLRRGPSRLGNGAEATEPMLTKLFGSLRRRTGHDFSMYRRSTVLRRLDRRLRFNDVSGLEEYLPLLEASEAESQALLRDLLISVSSFFRDPDAYDALAAMAPSLFEGKGAADTVRVWVVGCATGEEAYSIAMVLADHAATLDDPPRLQLFATDIDEKGYAWARAGLYDAGAVANVPPERLRRFFTKEAGGYRVDKALRELVLFAGHNVLHDPPFSRIDLISCRNLFIYLRPEAQEQVLETFHFALNPGGTLFLGASESIGDSGLFEATAGSTHRLFRRTTSPYRVAPRLVTADPRPRPGATDTVPPPGAESDGGRQRFSYGALHVRMLEEYAPPSVVVDDRMDVVHLSAGAGRFLRLADGEPTRNVLRLAEGGLRTVLRTALHHAFDSRTPTSRPARMELDGTSTQVRVEVRPTADLNGQNGPLALILFRMEDAAAPSPAARVEEDAAAPRPAEIALEEELERTRELLESTDAAHDRTVAELQRTNEELQSINEEQKAATEELETGREEIQSINEELTTINQEHQSTIEELKRTNADLQNLIESTDIGTIFLDRESRIRRFTPAVTAIFNFSPGDRGRPLSHITHRLRYDGLLDDVKAVLESGEQIEREVSSEGEEWYILRINPYRSQDDAREGAVLTFFDETARHEAREELREAKIAAEAASRAKSTFLSTVSHEFRTPLNAVLGFAENLHVTGRLTDAQSHHVERIKAGGWHLASMIDEILSFAKLDGGHEVVRSEPVDARQIAREAFALAEPAAIAEGLDFALDLPDGPVNLETDVGKARQVLINLSGNAVKYTTEGEVRLRVRTQGKRVTFEVRDTGIGIAPEHHGRIFERFWQVRSEATRAAGGMGIGLAAAREFARLLRGDVEVESELGRGTSFVFWLPAAYDD